MAFCASCGSPVEGRFCAKCGATVGVGAPPVSAGVPPAGAATPQPVAASAGMSDNAASALCYVLGFITGILFLVLDPYNKNKLVRFHAFQSIFLSVGLILIRIVLSILFGIIGYTMGYMLYFGLMSLVGLASLVIWLYMIIVTYQGKKVVLPIIGSIAQQQAG